MTREFSTTVHVSAPAERLIEAISTFDAWSEWMPGLVDVDLLTDGPFGVGTSWRETRKMFGKEASEVFEVVEFEPPHCIRLYVDGSKGSSRKGEYYFDYRFSPDGDGTLVEFEGSVEMPGIVFRLLGGLLIGTFRKACDTDLEALKSYVEHMDRESMVT